MNVSPHERDTIMELKVTYDRLADVIMAFGTTAVRGELEAIARQVRHDQPGAAAALTDWDGAEIARERAFAVIRNQQLREAALDGMRDHHLAHTMLRGVA